MKKKTKFIAEQITFIALVNYLLLFNEGLIYNSYLSANITGALAFFHLGTLSTLLMTIRSKDFSTEKESLLTNVNVFFYLGFITLLLFQKFTKINDQLPLLYAIALILLFLTMNFFLESIRSYHLYRATLLPAESLSHRETK